MAAPTWDRQRPSRPRGQPITGPPRSWDRRRHSDTPESAPGVGRDTPSPSLSHTAQKPQKGTRSNSWQLWTAWPL